MIVPLNILIRNNATGRWLRLDSQPQNINISTVVPGGFGTFTFQMGERVVRQLTYPLDAFYACDVIVSDQSGQTLFEGILTDVKKHSDETDSYYECESTGWQILMDNPYRNMIVERNIAWDQENIAFQPSLIRPSLMSVTTGQVDATDGTKIGVRLDVISGTAITSGWRNGAQIMFPAGTRLQRIMFDYNVDISRTVTFQVVGLGLNDAGAQSAGSAVFIAPGLGSSSINSTAWTSGAERGMILGFECVTGGTSSAAIFAQIYNIRFLCTRVAPTGTSTSEPVYGHEVVSDIVSQSLLSQDYSQIETDTSYQIPQFSYQVSDTQRNALDAITAYYARYWAVWESKRFAWKSWTPVASADWVVSRSAGAQLDIDPTILNAARSAVVQWSDAAGIQQETSITDPNQDNAYTLAGASKTTIIPLGIQGLASAAAQLGSVYWPDHSYEVVGGTITVPANARCFSQTYGTMLPAYRIRAGESVRVRDAATAGSFFDNKTWNRSTLFRITATDLDWDNQIMKLTVDNAQASIDQLLGRVQLNLSSKFGT